MATGAAIQVEPAAALGMTNAYVSFGQFSASNDRDVYVARAAPPFTNFTSVRADKDNTGADAFFIRSAVAQAGTPDKIVVVWESLKGSGSSVTTDVYLQASVDGGVTWKANDVRVNSVVGVAELPVLATDGAGRAFIAWRDQRAGNAEVYADVYDFATGALAGNQAISGGHPSQAITISADAGNPNVYIAWTDLRAQKKAIRVNRSANFGAAFAADGVIVNPDSTFADADAPPSSPAPARSSWPGKTRATAPPTSASTTPPTPARHGSPRPAAPTSAPPPAAAPRPTRAWPSAPPTSFT